jgi:hypothetical protein
MNVISASRRTDIPAWYGTWFRNRIAAGAASYRNPFGGQMHTVSLAPEDVIAFVFWTRNATPFLPVLDEVLAAGYRAAFQYTITDYGLPVEGSSASAAEAVEGFLRTVERLGPDAVRWRYDPIILGPGMNREFHLANFESLLKRLKGWSGTCHTSFAQFYRKTRRGLAAAAGGDEAAYLDPPDEEKLALARELRAMAAAAGIELVSCCYPLLEKAGIPQGRCVDADLIRRLRPDLESPGLKPRPTREGCGCAASRDIGAYDTCPGGCAYCYANRSGSAAIRKAMEGHDPEREYL